MVKRQKSCTLIVSLIILSYQTSLILNSSSKSTGIFFLQTKKYLLLESFSQEKAIFFREIATFYQILFESWSFKQKKVIMQKRLKFKFLNM